MNSTDPKRRDAFITSYISESGLKQAGDGPESYRTLLDALARQSEGLEVIGSELDGQILTVRTRRNGVQARIWMSYSMAEPGKLDGLTVFPPKPDSDPKYQPWPMPEAAARLSEESAIRLIERQAAQASRADRFSGVVLIARGDRILIHRAYGLAERDHDVPNRKNTRFHMGSMPKMFTAVAIAQLVEAGKISFDDTLSERLPEYPNRAAAEKITVRHLLTHTAGLGGLFERPGYDRRKKYRSHSDYFPLFADSPLLFEPGKEWSYSNEGYLVLGAIIEKVSGKSYDDYIRDRILQPAGMKETGNVEVEEVTPNRAVGYLHDAIENPLGLDPRRSHLQFLGWRGNACGGAYSTASDLLRFALALRNHRLLSPAMTEEMTSPKVEMGANTGWRYGFGFMTQAFGGREVRGHNGGGIGSGINAEMEMFWDASGAPYTVIVLGNYDAPAASDLCRDICSFLAARRGS
ncbi:MAG: beta-lactamase family protein [Armatimonadetes bacterium]|nr:beta-lactamase family protein [Armatimonadota bacterium]